MIRNKSHDNPNICEKFTLSLAAKKSFSDLKFSFPEVFLRFLGNRPDQFGIWDEKLPDSALNWREKREAVRRNGAGDGEMKDRLMSPVTKRVRLAADRERARVWSWAENLPLHMVVWAVGYGMISGRPLGRWGGIRRSHYYFHTFSDSIDCVWEWQNGNVKCFGERGVMEN